MNIVQCRFCRKPFADIGGRICPACLQQLDRDFITVRDYIDENPTANIKKVAEETEVPEVHIIHLIKEGRLIIDNPSGDGGGLIVCEVCHKSIRTGRMCDDCKTKLSSTMDSKLSGASSSPPRETQKKALSPEDLKKLGRIR